ncbi:uncharacterized protein LOC125806062 [Astyanax mexicanus]|uniref:uncharacterized protein LOC125806062 n=1 Tax=Astyanax mexicanus TaxID=7994 RepID=UPI0020CB4D6B|nr:uncharacterized protein LOC125806062 [Astyanax mexicanus]
MAAPGDSRLCESLTRRHGVRIVSRASIEDVCLSVGSAVGHGNIVSASRMNNAIVLFVKTVDQALALVQSGVTVNGLFTHVLPLSSPSKKIILSNVPPFIKDELIRQELSRFGRVCSEIKKLNLGCKSPLIKHLVSFRRQVFMVLKDGADELDLVLKLRVEGFDYTIYASSDTEMKCFRCGQTGHLVRACPEKVNSGGAGGAEAPGPDTAEPAVVVPPAAVARPAVKVPAAEAVPGECEQVGVGSDTAMADERRVAEGEHSSAEPAVEEQVMEEQAVEEQAVVGEVLEEQVGEVQAVEVQAVEEQAVEEQAVEVQAVEVQAVGEPGEAQQLEAKVQASCSGLTPAPAAVHELEAEVLMEDEAVFKVPTNKRKCKANEKGAKQAKKEVEEVESEVSQELEGYTSDSGWSVCSQDERTPVVYTAKEVKRFLRVTKGQWGVRVEDHFPDTIQFVHDVKLLKREGAFTRLELYESEWSESLEVEDRFLQNMAKLEQQSAEVLEAELSMEEIHGALQGMENGRAPGIDGIPVEFYKAFWSVLGQDVLEVLRSSIRDGSLPLSCRRAVLTLLPKKGDLTNLKNWRPVSLLCSDCKLLSKALASRLGKVMEQVIHIDQTYCVPGRSIFDNVHLIRDVLDVSRLLGLKTGLLFLDQEKAFDRVEHGYLWKVLENFGFNPGFIAMIKVLYSEIESAVLVDFFWDRLHWVPQGLLYLPKENGGQGLVHLASRTAAFRLQFLQRLLAGPAELTGLSLHWLLEEPLLCGTRLDLAGTVTPALTRVLLSSGVTTLRHVVDAAGPDFADEENMALRLGMRSLRLVARLLQGWKSAFSPEEREQVRDYSAGVVSPAEDDPFPEVTITPDLEDCEGPLLDCTGESCMNLSMVSVCFSVTGRVQPACLAVSGASL